MTNLQNRPNQIPLILILIGTSLLAYPAALGTLALLDSSGGGIGVGEKPGLFLFCLSVAGFTLFAGYILTAVLQKHSAVFWFFSFLYNFALSGVYWYFIFYGFLSAPADLLKNADAAYFLLLPLWTTFVTVASIFYFIAALWRKKN